MVAALLFPLRFSILLSSQQTNFSYSSVTSLGEGHKMGYWAGGMFEVSPWATALLFVIGGFETDVKLRVLRTDRKPLGGLLAVGTIAGGIISVDYPLLAAGNSYGRCLTWGMVAAETLANGEA